MRNRLQKHIFRRVYDFMKQKFIKQRFIKIFRKHQLN